MKTGSVIAFARKHIIALRIIFLSGVLSYAVVSLLHFDWIWRNHTSHAVGTIMGFGSFPWSLPWVLYQHELRWLIPGWFSYVPGTLVVGAGFGLNLMLACGVAWFMGEKVVRSSRWRS